jgi:hypothetical protein
VFYLGLLNADVMKIGCRQDNRQIPAFLFPDLFRVSGDAARVPDTFEVWIDKNSPRIPLKIKIKGIVNCSILMKGYSLHNN